LFHSVTKGLLHEFLGITSKK